jgi:protein NrfD
MTKRIFYVIGVLALLIGIWGFYIRITTGHQEANYGSYIVWGLWVAMYLFFTGIAAGGFVLATLDYLFEIPIFKGLGKTALLGAFVSLGAGLLSIWLDLGHMDRIWKIYFQGNSSSVMWQMVWGYTLFGLLIVTSLYFAVQSPDSKWLRILMILGLPLALFVSGAVGALLGVQAARPFWHVGLFPVQFPIFSLASGVAMLLAAVGLFGKQDDPNRASQLKVLVIMSVVLQAIKLYFLWADFSQSIYGNVPFNIQAVNEVLFGEYWYAFWILQLGLGSLVPIIVLVQPKLATNGFWAGIMGILILLGFAVARANIIFPALSVPELDALTTAFTGPHLTFDYFPSMMEWAVTLGTVGLATLGFLIGSDYIASKEASTSQEVQA